MVYARGRPANLLSWERVDECNASLVHNRASILSVSQHVGPAHSHIYRKFHSVMLKMSTQVLSIDVLADNNNNSLFLYSSGGLLL